MCMPVPKNLNIFVGNLPEDASRDAILMQFESKPEIEKVQLPYSEQTKKTKGYMYLKCKTSKDFLHVLNQSHVFQGHQLVLREYYEQIDKQNLLDFDRSDSIIFLRNVPPTVTNAALKTGFSVFGNVKIAFCFKGQKQNKKLCFGFVQFEDAVSVSKLPDSNVELEGEEMVQWRSFYTPPEKEAQKQSRRKNMNSIVEFYARVEKISNLVELNHTQDNLRLTRNFDFSTSLSWRKRWSALLE